MFSNARISTKMIIRQSLSRRGGRITKFLSDSWTRPLTTEFNGSSSNNERIRFSAAEIAKTEVSVDNQLQETHSIESMLQKSTSHIIPRINDETHTTDHLNSEEVVERYKSRAHQKHNISRIGGSVIKPSYDPSALVINPPSPSDVTLELLLASQSHLGHSTSLWNPVNSRYIFGVRQGIHIISLDVTASHLRRACRVVSGVAEHGGLILFVGTRPGQEAIVVRAAGLAGGCHLYERWTPGSITNGPQILKHCKMKLVDEFDREIKGFENVLQDRPPLKPDLVVCLNPLENWVMLHECSLNGIPTMGIIDTDANPTWVTYPIPANDDSLRCVQLIAGVLGRAGEEGQNLRREKAKEGIITYTPLNLSGGGNKSN